MILKLPDKQEIQRRAGAFFHSQRWKNTLVFLGFAGLASCFWALQYFRQQFEFEVPIKVYYTHIPVEIALSEELPTKINLHLQDKGIAYLNYLFSPQKRSLSITIDLDAIPSNKTSYIIDQISLRNMLSEKLFATTQLKFFSPDKIEINYSHLEQKELPVAINGTVSPSTGYLFMDSIRIEPDRVVVYGNKALLDTLQEIQTQPLNYKNIDREWTVTAGLQAPEGIHLPVDNVKLSASAEEYTEKTFELPVVCNNMPANRNVRFFPSTVELIARVGLSRYTHISKSNFEIAVNYNDLTEKNSTNYSLTLTRKPVGVESYRIVPAVIEFLIEQKK